MVMCRLSVRQFVWKYWIDYWFVCGGCRIQFDRLSIVKHCCISDCTLLCFVVNFKFCTSLYDGGSMILTTSTGTVVLVQWYWYLEPKYWCLYLRHGYWYWYLRLKYWYLHWYLNDWVLATTLVSLLVICIHRNTGTPRIPGLLTDTSDQICFYFCSFSFFHFLVFGSVQKIKLIWCRLFSAS